jgi:hypothetical protein
MKNNKWQFVKRSNYEINDILWKTKEVMQHNWKMQYISLLSKYTKLNSRGVFSMCIHVWQQRLRKRLTVAVQIIKQAFRNRNKILWTYFDILALCMPNERTYIQKCTLTHPPSIRYSFHLSFLLLVHAEWDSRTQLPNYTASHPNKLWSEIGNLFINRRIQHTTIL